MCVASATANLRKKYTRERKHCFRAIQLLGGVKAKWFAILEVISVSLIMSIVMSSIYDGMRINQLSDKLLFGVLYILMSLTDLSVWVVAYPKRYRPACVLFAGAVGIVIMLPSTILGACRSTLLSLQPNQYLRAVADLYSHGSVAITFIIWGCLYHGAIKDKFAFIFVLIFPPCFFLTRVLDFLKLEEPRRLLLLIMFLLLFTVGTFGGHFCKTPKVIVGPRSSFTSLVGYGLATIGPGLLAFFMGVYNGNGTPFVRATVWLVYKVISFPLTRVWCKLSCYAMQDDVHSLLLIFMMVATFEFCTELTFISITPFSREFFGMVLLKAALHICLKGGLLLKLHIKLSECIGRSKISGSCFARFLLAFTKEISDRGCPYLHLGVEAGDGRVLLKFLSDLLYCDIILFSSVICSIACSACIGFELVLLQYFPDTFHHGVWTARINTAINPWDVFAAYLFVVFSNIIVAFIVLYLFLRDSRAVMAIGVFNGGIDRQRRVRKSVHRFRVVMLRSISKTQVATDNKSEEKHADPVSVSPTSFRAQLELESGPKTLQKQFYQANMKLHNFEQLFFHEEKFYFYFWLFYVLVTCFINVSWHQWVGHMKDCGVAFGALNFTTLDSVPTQAKTVVRGAECWFFSLNASDLHRNATPSDNDTFVEPLFQCVHYYGNDTVYT